MGHPAGSLGKRRASSAGSGAGRRSLAAAVAALWLHAPVWAAPGEPGCTCPPVPTPEAAASSAVAVFEGKVVAMTQRYGRRRGQVGSETRFQVLQAWKGEVGSQVTIWSEAPSFCGYSFMPAGSFLVYARASEEGGIALETDRCMRTRILEGAGEDLAVLRSLKARGAATPGPGANPAPEATGGAGGRPKAGDLACDVGALLDLATRAPADGTVVVVRDADGRERSLRVRPLPGGGPGVVLEEAGSP